MPTLNKDPFEKIVKDKRKWYQMWCDDIWTLSWKDLAPSIMIGGGIGYGLICLGVGMTLSVTTGGVGLGVLTAGFITWQVFKYPIKRFAANIVGLFKEEKPRWGQYRNSKIEALETSQNELSSQKELITSLTNKLSISNDFNDKLIETNNQLKVQIVRLENELSKAITILTTQSAEFEKQLKAFKELRETQKIIYESDALQKVSDVTQKFEEQLDTQKEAFEQQVEDLKHEHLRTLKAINSKLAKAETSNKTLTKKNQELVAEKDRLIARVQKLEQKFREPLTERSLSPDPPAYTATSASKPKSPKFFSEGKNDTSDDESTKSGTRSPGLGSDEDK